MKSSKSYILYIFIIILIGSGLALFLTREQTASFLSDNAGVSNLTIPTKIASSSKDTLDTSLFTNSKFLSLKNNINKFDFDSICKTPVGQIETVSTSSDGETITTTQTLSCTQGNSLPFPLPLKTNK